MDDKEYISIGKILNFFGIKGEAKIGFDNENQIKNAKRVILADNKTRKELTVQKIRFHKNFAVVKFAEINDINDILPFKGQRIFIPVKEAKQKLGENEFLIQDLINCTVYNENNEKIGIISDISSNCAQDLLNIKNSIGKIHAVPFVDEFFPVVDIEHKKIIIKPIEGLLS